MHEGKSCYDSDDRSPYNVPTITAFSVSLCFAFIACFFFARRAFSFSRFSLRSCAVFSRSALLFVWNSLTSFS